MGLELTEIQPLFTDIFAFGDLFRDGDVIMYELLSGEREAKPSSAEQMAKYCFLFPCHHPCKRQVGGECPHEG